MTPARLFCSAILLLLAGQTSADQPKEPPKHFTNSLGMKFVWVPAGTFMMGSSEGAYSPKRSHEKR